LSSVVRASGSSSALVAFVRIVLPQRRRHITFALVPCRAGGGITEAASRGSPPPPPALHPYARTYTHGLSNPLDYSPGSNLWTEANPVW